MQALSSIQNHPCHVLAQSKLECSFPEDLPLSETTYLVLTHTLAQKEAFQQ